MSARIEPIDCDECGDVDTLCDTCKAALAVRPLSCCCCGASTRGRQWWNRDIGYGLCDACADNPALMRGETPESFERLYGVAGFNFKIEGGLS